MLRVTQISLFVLVFGLRFFFALDAMGEEENTGSLQGMSAPEISNAFLGDWWDERDRWWFGIDLIENSEIRTARFRLAELKEGSIQGTSLLLVSRSCVGIFGCYEYFIEARLIAPNRLDMTATSDTCTFEVRCRESGEVVHYILTRK